MHVRKTRNVTNFFIIPKTRLKSYDKTVFVQGPRIFNIMCTNFNKTLIQCLNDIPLQNRFSKSFKNSCKGFILDLQSYGNDTEWNLENFPLTDHKIQI